MNKSLTTKTGSVSGLETIATYDMKTGVIKARPDIAKQMQKNLLTGAFKVYWDKLKEEK